MQNKGLSKDQLKELARRVVVAQGNAFIKDLLRDNFDRIGATKDEFIANLEEAIDQGSLSQQGLETWLEEVEGWGNQYLYIVAPPSADTAAIATAISTSPIAHLCNAPASLDFPDELTLKRVVANEHGLSLAWHQGKEAWNRWSAQDFQKQSGLDLVRFDAYRQRLDRSVVRFEWRYADPYAAILIHRNPAIEHKAVFAAIQALLADLGLPDQPFTRIELSQAIRSSSRRVRGVQSTRFEMDGGYIEMASTLPGGGIESVEPVRVVLQSVDVNQFDRAQGMLNFVAEEHGTSRSFSVEVFGAEAKLRIWAQCKREDVMTILQLIWAFNEQS